MLKVLFIIFISLIFCNNCSSNIGIVTTEQIESLPKSVYNFTNRDIAYASLNDIESVLGCPNKIITSKDGTIQEYIYKIHGYKNCFIKFTDILTKIENSNLANSEEKYMAFDTTCNLDYVALLFGDEEYFVSGISPISGNNNIISNQTNIKGESKYLFKYISIHIGSIEKNIVSYESISSIFCKMQFYQVLDRLGSPQNINKFSLYGFTATYTLENGTLLDLFFVYDKPSSSPTPSNILDGRVCHAYIRTDNENYAKINFKDSGNEELYLDIDNPIEFTEAEYVSSTKYNGYENIYLVLEDLGLPHDITYYENYTSYWYKSGIGSILCFTFQNGDILCTPQYFCSETLFKDICEIPGLPNHYNLNSLFLGVSGYGHYPREANISYNDFYKISTSTIPSNYNYGDLILQLGIPLDLHLGGGIGTCLTYK